MEASNIGLDESDIVHALSVASKCTWQPKHQTWRVKGADRFGDTLVMGVDIQDAVIVVTVFD